MLQDIIEKLNSDDPSIWKKALHKLAKFKQFSSLSKIDIQDIFEGVSKLIKEVDNNKFGEEINEDFYKVMKLVAPYLTDKQVDTYLELVTRSRDKSGDDSWVEPICMEYHRIIIKTLTLFVPRIKKLPKNNIEDFSENVLEDSKDIINFAALIPTSTPDEIRDSVNKFYPIGEFYVLAQLTNKEYLENTKIKLTQEQITAVFESALRELNTNLENDNDSELILHDVNYAAAHTLLNLAPSLTNEQIKLAQPQVLRILNLDHKKTPTNLEPLRTFLIITREVKFQKKNSRFFSQVEPEYDENVLIKTPKLKG